jgi:hypothetical protein
MLAQYSAGAQADRVLLYRRGTRFIAFATCNYALYGGIGTSADITIGASIPTKWWLVVARFGTAGLSIDINGTNRTTIAVTNFEARATVDRYTTVGAFPGGASAWSIDDVAAIWVYDADIGATASTNLWLEQKATYGY